MKPSWTQAPNWAQYLAMDCDGTWWWYSEMPEYDSGEWFTGRGTKIELAIVPDDLSETLEPRPKTT